MKLQRFSCTLVRAEESKQIYLISTNCLMSRVVCGFAIRLHNQLYTYQAQERYTDGQDN
jgi:hypothetical protein